MLTENRIISFEWSYLDSAAALYQHAYGVPHYGNLTPQEISREVIIGHVMRSSFIGVLALEDDRRVVGLAWGYASPNDNKRLKELVIKKLGREWVENTFVVEAFALHPDYFGTDLSGQLLDGLTNRVQDNHYERMRARLERARLDHLHQTLQAQGWEQLQSLAHVVWLGKTL